MSFKNMTIDELIGLRDELWAKYEQKKSLNLDLSMARGKPETAQLDLSTPMLDKVRESTHFICEDGMDVRNYGVLSGITEARRFFANILDVGMDNIVIYGTASLTLMYDTVARAYIKGILGSKPWCKLDKVKFLCPVPGYDRHFTICEFFGIEMINIPMDENGPDMDMVERLVSEDESIKGIWCVPKYSNPSGIVYSDEVVRRFARLRPAAKDFRIYWDNAYFIHHLYRDNQPEILNIVTECEKAGNPDMVYEFCSTSKITFPGSGVSALAASKANIDETIKFMGAQTISHDKVNQLRHVMFLQNKEQLKEHMMKHADIMRPKFEKVLDMLEAELGDADIATWTKPLGGYFISFDAMDGCAKKIVEMCSDAGIILTDAGATYPYGNDPRDSNIRIAPSFPPLEELITACEVFIICVKIVSIDKILESKKKGYIKTNGTYYR
ncbi:MAG: aminotransferase class I/II-fold pyridoxal phosphate-dependent enzyme [Clostridia bacterium]|nr:aminotransferase class I/II-fold pyridoxal phosphate-dependent enzyme [Clostridia bacterium]